MGSPVRYRSSENPYLELQIFSYVVLVVQRNEDLTVRQSEGGVENPRGWIESQKGCVSRRTVKNSDSAYVRVRLFQIPFDDGSRFISVWRPGLGSQQRIETRILAH